MVSALEITFLVENGRGPAPLVAEHGLSLWIKAGAARILFDTGASANFAANAKRLGMDISQADALVLSHGHHDHTGGLVEALAAAKTVPIFVHPEATQPRYTRSGRLPYANSGMPETSLRALRGSQARIVPATKPTMVANGAWVTGSIPRRADFEDTGGPFFRDGDCREADPITDDQAMWIETTSGVAVIVGCAHSGVVNTLDYVSQMTGATSFCAVVGGMHLLDSGEDRIRRTADALERYEVQVLGACHCTGDAAMGYFKSCFADRLRYCATGVTLSLA